MTWTTFLVPLRYPLKAPGVKTVRRAIDLASQLTETHLSIVHVNLFHRGKGVKRVQLRQAVEGVVGPLANASYHVRDSVLLEDAILSEARYQDADYVVIGKSARARWRQALAIRLGTTVDLEAFLSRQLEAEIVVT